MTTEQALDKMAAMAPYIGEIFDDKDASEVLKAVREEKGETQVGKTVAKLLPLFAGKHRDALMNIVAISSDMAVEEVRAQPILDTIGAMQHAMIDEAMMFFVSCLRMVKNL